MDSEKLLGQYLRARREITSPDAVGLPNSGRRRTPGLRREEVAMLAGVSTDYYIRLEQGRERHPSGQVLGALARALELDADGARYLYEVAHPRPRMNGARDGGRVSPNLLWLMRSWTHTPALVAGPRMDVLAKNPLATALYEGLDESDNIIRMIFLDPGARQLFPAWDRVARGKVANLRASVGQDLSNPFLADLIDELNAKSTDFRQLWGRHDVRSAMPEAKTFNHRFAGELVLTYESFTVNSAPGQQLIVYQAEPGSPSEVGLELLADAVAHKAH